MCDKIRAHVRGLASIGVLKQHGSMLIPIIMSDLPAKIRLEIARKSTGDVWEIHELLESIKTEIEAREVSEGGQSSSQVRKPGGYLTPQGSPQPVHLPRRIELANIFNVFLQRIPFFGFP